MRPVSPPGIDVGPHAPLSVAPPPQMHVTHHTDVTPSQPMDVTTMRVTSPPHPYPQILRAAKQLNYLVQEITQRKARLFFGRRKRNVWFNAHLTQLNRNHCQAMSWSQSPKAKSTAHSLSNDNYAQNYLPSVNQMRNRMPRSLHVDKRHCFVLFFFWGGSVHTQDRTADAKASHWDRFPRVAWWRIPCESGRGFQPPAKK